MVETRLEEVLTRLNIEEAIDYLGGKRDSCGADGMALSELPRYWEINGGKIRNRILECRYKPGPVKNIEIINRKGKRRIISVMNSVDRLILRAIVQIIQPECEQILSDNCYAFRDGMGVTAAISKACDYIQAGDQWAARIDIKDYFDSIPISGLQSLVAKTFSDLRLVSLLQRYLSVKVEDDGRIIRKRKGIITGSPISPLFSNLYLSGMDRQFEEEGLHYCRYADDIVVFCSSKENAQRAFNRIEQILRDRYKLEINTEKSSVVRAIQEIYLGCQFEIDRSTELVTAVKQRKETQSVYRRWQKDGVQRIDRNYHLVNDGILTKRDFTLLFDNEDGKKYIPVETTDSITVYSNAIIATDVLKYLSDKNIYLSIVDKFGNLTGHYAGIGPSARSLTMMKQATLYNDEQERLSLAKKLEVAYIHNINANLKYYGRRNKSELIRRWTERFPKIRDEINGADNVSKLMMIEARCRQEYYGLFNEIISVPGYEFTCRTRRPPMDEINAMISFGNTLLYNRIAMEIHKTSLDIRIGIVHSTSRRSQTLNLDIADVFKPILVDRTIFTLINKRILSKDRDFVTNEDGSVYLSNTGKRIFISEFNNKLFQTITENSKRITYDTKIKQEISKLYRFFVKGEKYKPYKYTN